MELVIIFLMISIQDSYGCEEGKSCPSIERDKCDDEPRPPECSL